MKAVLAFFMSVSLFTGCTSKQSAQKNSCTAEPTKNLDDVDNQWKLRGLQADEKLYAPEKIKKKTTHEKCSEYLERSFAVYSKPEFESQLKSNVDGHRLYQIVIVTPIGNKPGTVTDDMTLLSVDYDPQGAATGTTLLKLAKDATIKVLTGSDGFKIGQKECDFWIYPREPLKSWAQERTD